MRGRNIAARMGLRKRMLREWRIPESRADELLDQWDVEAECRGLSFLDDQYRLQREAWRSRATCPETGSRPRRTLATEVIDMARNTRTVGPKTGGGWQVTGGGSTIYAIDSRDGRTLWSGALGQSAYSVPMTYRTKAGRQIVVIAVGGANGSKLVAFAIP